MDWFSLTLKLDDFTSGFQTTCADMAGGWEEVVSAGSWVGTRAGTGVTLGKQSEADGAAVIKKDEANKTAVVQAKWFWLISRATVTLNFLKKSMPRIGPATVACKKLEVKSLP
jgi:hypothetical protein